MTKKTLQYNNKLEVFANRHALYKEFSPRQNSAIPIYEEPNNLSKHKYETARWKLQSTLKLFTLVFGYFIFSFRKFIDGKPRIFT